MAWIPEELRRMDQTAEVKVAPFREDGATYARPTVVWCVVVDDAVYLRAYRG